MACGLAVAAIVTALQQSLASRVAVWVTATAIASTLVVLVRTTGASPLTAGAALTLIAVGGAAVAVLRDGTLRYLPEATA